MRWIPITLVALAGAVGCGALSDADAAMSSDDGVLPQDASARAETGTQTDTTAPAPHGVVQMLGEAISEMSLTANQEAVVEQLGAQIEPLQAAVDEAESDILSKLSDQVKANHIDRAALDSDIGVYVQARVQLSASLQASIVKLHQILDPDQRMDLADALESRVYQAVSAATSGELLDDFADDLGLTKDQKETIQNDLDALKPALRTERRALHGAIEAFRGDVLSTDHFPSQDDVTARARQRSKTIVDLTESIMKMLDECQRRMLAHRIEQAALARSLGSEEPASDGATGDEQVGAAVQPVWAARGVRVGGVRGGVVRGGVVVGGAPGYYYGRARAYPYAAGWGWGF